MSSDEQTVQIVEDEEPLAEMFGAWLDDHEVEIALDGEEAFETIDEETDVVLLDRRMPGIKGEEVLEGIRAEGYDCRVAFVSAVGPAVETEKLSFDAYLTKPVDSDTLQETVETLGNHDHPEAEKPVVAGG